MCVLPYPFCTLFQNDEGRLQDSEDHTVEDGHDHHDPNDEDEDHHDVDVDTEPHGVEEDHDPHDIEPDAAGQKEDEDEEIKGKFND